MRHKQSTLVGAETSVFARSSLMASKRGEQCGGRARELPVKGEEIRLCQGRKHTETLQQVCTVSLATGGAVLVSQQTSALLLFRSAVNRQALKIIRSSC